MTDFSPREIVSELDRHIIGQNDAKRAVAIALRNRWRRLQLTGPMRDEVLPKNILMIGPTGCGKTEISRRLAQPRQRPLPQGRGHQVHRGRLRGPRRRADRARPRRDRHRPRQGGEAQGRRGQGPRRRRGTAARRPRGREGVAGDPRQLPPAAARRRARRQGGRDRGGGGRPEPAHDGTAQHAGRLHRGDLDRRHLRSYGRQADEAPPPVGQGRPRAAARRGEREAARPRGGHPAGHPRGREQRHRVPRRDRQDLRPGRPGWGRRHLARGRAARPAAADRGHHRARPSTGR